MLLFYLISRESGEFSISPIARVDKPHSGVEILIPGLPLALAQSLVITIETRRSRDVKKEILKILRKHPGLEGMDWRWEHIQPEIVDEVSMNTKLIKSVIAKSAEDVDFFSRVKDRQLSEGDLQRLANETGLSLMEVIFRCHENVRRGIAEWIPAVQKVERQGWVCSRCGETEIEEWPSIYGLTGTCPSCSALGSLSSLQAFYRSRNLNPSAKKTHDQGSQEQEKIDVTFSPHWALSEAQEQASREVLEFVSSETGNTLLLWAACGAGKTEVCFPAAAWALQRGQKVLFATPRQDVVLDVAPRLERDFLGLNVSVLTGVSTAHFSPALLVLATTHQVLRFHQAFDLIFMDEVDAFPYQGNAALAWGLQQALKPGGKIIYLTATPAPENRAKIQRGEMKLVRLPARHHRKALPVPEWKSYCVSESTVERTKVKGSHEILRGRALAELVEWISFLAEAGPVLIFVPKISWVNEYVIQLRPLFPEWVIDGSYSSDPGRHEKIEKLRKGEYPVFISTSILERGVTVPNAQVIVLEADHKVFDERGLVQMAGRVGRTRENPRGRALFLAKQKTPAIEKAIHWIEEQNQLAMAKGLID